MATGKDEFAQTGRTHTSKAHDRTIDLSVGNAKTGWGWYCEVCQIDWKHLDEVFNYCPNCGTKFGITTKEDAQKVATEASTTYAYGELRGEPTSSFEWYGVVSDGGIQEQERVTDIIMFKGTRFIATDKDHIYMLNSNTLGGDPWELVK